MDDERTSTVFVDQSGSSSRPPSAVPSERIALRLPRNDHRNGKSNKDKDQDQDQDNNKKPDPDPSAMASSALTTAPSSASTSTSTSISTTTTTTSSSPSSSLPSTHVSRHLNLFGPVGTSVSPFSSSKSSGSATTTGTAPATTRFTASASASASASSSSSPSSSSRDASTSASLTQADTETNCDRRRPEEEDIQRRLTMSSELMSRTVTPFLKDHIPGLYSPLAKKGTIQSLQRQNKDPNSRYCYRHRPDSKCRRAADEVKMAKIQTELENLKPDDQQAITHVWSLFSAAPAKHRELMLQGIMTQCCFPQLSKVSREVADQLKIDFITALPPEDKLAYKILCYLDPLSLCKAALVSRQWRELADDDQVWYRMCEQHIDRKCTKCGFGLPLLERKRLRDWTRMRQLSESHRNKQIKPRVPNLRPSLPAPNSLRDSSPLKRDASEFHHDEHHTHHHHKRQCNSSNVADNNNHSHSHDHSHNHNNHNNHKEGDAKASSQDIERRPRAWKDVYRDRFRVGYNWRNGKCDIKVFRGHDNGVTCLQIDDVMMASGSYDATIRIWNLETGEQTRVLRGHMQGIRSLQFDDKILVSGSLDGTIKIWNWHTGELLNTLVCHQGGVISVHLDGEWLASGSTDRTIKVFNLKTKESFSLKGHGDWVNQVRIDGTLSRTLFSASDDCKVKLWDLDSKQCIRTFEGHVGHVQQILTLPTDFEPDEDPATSSGNDQDATSVGSNGRGASPSACAVAAAGASKGESELSLRAAYGPGFVDDPDRPLPCRYILSSALDSTIKCWDTATGQCVRTFFGHLEGVWALVGDTLRVVSGANDTMVKVWEPRSGKCERTWTGHRGPVTCVGLSDSRMASGSEDGEVRLYSFQDRAGLETCGTPS